MRNYNWKTELKTNKTFIQTIRTKTRNQKNEKWNWNTKNKKDNRAYFFTRKRKEGEIKEMIISNNPTIKYLHIPGGKGHSDTSRNTTEG
jgi:hypothetical protein